MPKVVHFEICADNTERVVKFYSEAFGWKVEKWGGPIDYWTVEAGEQGEPGIDGGIKQRFENQNIINTISVPSVDEYTKKVEDCGGEVTQPKSPIPGVGYLAYCKDTEGNLFGILQSDPQAE